jgi:membrane associated rhomboid family serine protease
LCEAQRGEAARIAHHRIKGDRIVKIGMEIVAALVVAGILFIVFKLIGMAIQIAAIAALIGLVAGFVAARMFRRA